MGAAEGESEVGNSPVVLDGTEVGAADVVGERDG